MDLYRLLFGHQTQSRSVANLGVEPVAETQHRLQQQQQQHQQQQSSVPADEAAYNPNLQDNSVTFAPTNRDSDLGAPAAARPKEVEAQTEEIVNDNQSWSAVSRVPQDVYTTWAPKCNSEPFPGLAFTQQQQATDEHVQKGQEELNEKTREGAKQAHLPSKLTHLPATHVDPRSTMPAINTEKVNDMSKQAEKGLTQPSSSSIDGMELGVPASMETIDWPAALEQCSGDLAFLEELLVDLWNESNDHAARLRIAVREANNINVQHEAHSIKGAASNLMCHRLRIAALYLEKTGLAGTKTASEGPEREAVVKKMKDGMEVVERELSSLEVFLKEKKLL